MTVMIPLTSRFEGPLENVWGCAQGHVQCVSGRFANSAVAAYLEAL